MQLGMIPNKSLRQYMSALLLLRQLRQTFKNAKVGNMELPKGINVLIPVLSIHHKKELWVRIHQWVKSTMLFLGLVEVIHFSSDVWVSVGQIHYNGSKGGGGLHPISLHSPSLLTIVILMFVCPCSSPSMRCRSILDVCNRFYIDRNGCSIVTSE